MVLVAVGDRRGLDLLGGRDVHRRRRGLLRGRRRARRVRAARGTGSRCGPAAARTTRSARSSTSRRPWRSSIRDGPAGRGADRRGRRRRSAADPARARRSPVDAGRRGGESDVDESMVTGESLPGHEGSRRRAHRGHDQRERNAAGPRDQGRVGHGSRADRASSCRRRRTRRPRAAARRPRGVLAGASSRSIGGAAHVRARGSPSARPLQRSDPVRDHGRRGHLPRRARARDPDRDHGRHRPRREPRRSCSRTRWRSRRLARIAGRRDGQDRHAHEGRAGGHRGRGSTGLDGGRAAAPRDRGRARVGAPARRRPS